MDIFFDGACSAIIELRVVMKGSKADQHRHYLPQELHPNLC